MMNIFYSINKEFKVIPNLQTKYRKKNKLYTVIFFLNVEFVL